MVPPEMRQQPHVSFSQLDQYLRCPLKYRFTYVDRVAPDFVPAALAFGSGIHGAAAFFLRGLQQGQADLPERGVDVATKAEMPLVRCGERRADACGRGAAAKANRQRGVGARDLDREPLDDGGRLRVGALTREPSLYRRGADAAFVDGRVRVLSLPPLSAWYFNDGMY